MDDAAWNALVNRLRPDGGAEEFDRYMARVDRTLIRRYGIDSSDLPDWDYRTAFEDGMAPATAATKAARAAKGGTD